jgi:redox-sensitive bicupin YhaK (pirin superfamily)
MTQQATTILRPVVKLSPGVPASDGAGVNLHRVIGTSRLSELDPFLMLDEIRSDQASDYLAGFPDHPHRGFETVTYVLAGRMRHGDNKGNSGLLRPGSVQWMTAGRGIVHSEMPEQENGLMWGFQLWVNLPAEHKMMAPRYQDIAPDDVPEVELSNGARVRVLAGTFEGVRGSVDGIVTEPTLLDVSVPGGAEVIVPVPATHNAFLYVFDGTALAGDPSTEVPRGTAAVMGRGDGIRLRGGSSGAARVLLAAARPIGEPVARYGPFVMNTTDEIKQAIYDFQSGRF